jgi:threonine/homoserine/homoserine lactone efflux protein
VDALLAGLGLGLGSGVAPGPLLALVVAATLRGGFPAGVRVALAPLLTDLPIIVLSLTVLSRFPPLGLAVMAIVGGLVVCWFGVESLREARAADPVHDAAGAPAMSPGRARRQGALANLTSPAPWLFWLSAGGAVLVSSYRGSPWAAVAFLAGFYVALVGTKAAVAWGVAAGRHRLTPSRYRALLAASGLLLLGFGVLLAVQGVRAL